MSAPRDVATIIGAASAAEIGAYLALDSTLASLAAFGSVMGLGVLHFRAQRRQAPSASSPSPEPTHQPQSQPQPQPEIHAPIPVPLESSTMSSSETHRCEKTADAVAELGGRLDELQRALSVDQAPIARIQALCEGIATAASAPDATPAMIADARRGLAAILDAAASRQTLEHEEAATQAAAIAATCRGIEQRLDAAEHEILAAARRVEKEALGTVARDVGALRQDVEKVGFSLAQMLSSTQTESTRALVEARQQASALAERVVEMQRRLDAGFAEIARTDARESVAAARTQLDDLARSAIALHGVTARVGESVTTLDARLAREIASLRAALDRLPSPEPVDLRPVHAGLAQIRADIHAIPRPDPAAPFPLDAVASTVRATEQRLAQDMRALHAAIEAMPRPDRPEPFPLHEIALALRATEERLARATRDAIGALPPPETAAPFPLHEIAGTLRAAEDRIALEMRAAVAEAIASLPRVEPAAPFPTHEITNALVKMEERLARITREMITALPRPEPVAFPVEEIATTIADSESGIVHEIQKAEERLAKLTLKAIGSIPEPDPVEFPIEKIAAAIARSEQRLAKLTEKAIASIPRAEPMKPLEKRLLGEMRELRDEIAALADRDTTPDWAPLLAALPDPPAPPRFPIDEIRASLRETEDSLASTVRAAVDALAPSATSDELRAALRHTEENLSRALRDTVAAIPPPAQARFPIDEIRASLRDTEDSLASTVRAAVDALAPSATPDDLRAALRHTEENLSRTLHDIVAALPPPSQPRFPLDEIRASLRETEDTLAAAMRANAEALPTPLDANDLRAGLREAEANLQRAIDNGISESVRKALAAVPAPVEPRFPLDEIRASLRQTEETLASAMRANVENLPSPLDANDLRASLRETEANLQRAIDNGISEGVREWLDALPAPVEPRFPLDEIRASLRQTEETLAAALRANVEALPAPLDANDLHAGLRKTEANLQRAIRAAVDALPAGPTSDEIRADLRRTEENLTRALQQAIAALPTPVEPRFPLDELRASLRDAEEAIRVSIQNAVTSLPTSATPEDVRASAREVEEHVARVVREAIGAIPPPAPAARFPVEEIRDALRGSEATLERAVRGAIEAIPPGASNDEVRAAVHAAEQNLSRVVREGIASLPIPAPARFPLDEIRAAVRESEEAIAASLNDVEASIERSTRSAVGALPSPATPDDLRANLRETEERIARVVRESVATLPTPPAPQRFPVDELVATVTAAEKRLATQVAAVRETIDALPRPEPAAPFPLGSFGTLVRASETRVSEQMRLVKDAIDALPRPEPAVPFPIASIQESLRAGEERIARHVSDVSDHARASRREEIHRLESAMRDLRESIAAMPRPTDPEPFPLDAIVGSIRSVEERLGARWQGDAQGTLERFAELHRAIGGLQTLLRDATTKQTDLVSPVADEVAALRGTLDRVASRFATLDDRLDKADTSWIPAQFSATREWLREDAAARALRDDSVSGSLAKIESLTSAMDARFTSLSQAVHAVGAEVAEAGGMTIEAVRERDDVVLGVVREVGVALSTKVEGAADRASDGLQALTDAVEDLRADVDERHRHLCAMLAANDDQVTRALAAAIEDVRRAADESRAGGDARADAFQTRLDKLARDLDARESAAKARFAATQGALLEAVEDAARRMDARVEAMETRAAEILQAAMAAREQEAERRFASRFAALESRLVEEIRNLALRAPVDAMPLPAPPMPRSHRRAVRPGE